MVQAAAVVPTYAPEDLLTLCVNLLLHFVYCRRIRSDNSVRVKSVTMNVSESVRSVNVRSEYRQQSPCGLASPKRVNSALLTRVCMWCSGFDSE